ncbi:nucleocapsid [Crithidia bombi leishbuvirus 1]|nr:nucleocapsid [Crithidia bombi leishbuvirus 1]
MSTPRQIQEICEQVCYQGNNPHTTRAAIESNGDGGQARIVAAVVGARGTNWGKICSKSANGGKAMEFHRISQALEAKYGCSTAHIASCYPEVVYDARVASNSKVSVNTLQFLKHVGLTKEEWIEANYEFCDLVGMSRAGFDAISEVVWNDSGFASVVGNRKKAPT